jgi:hypothetical protein
LNLDAALLFDVGLLDGVHVSSSQSDASLIAPPLQFAVSAATPPRVKALADGEFHKMLSGSKEMP